MEPSIFLLIQDTAGAGGAGTGSTSGFPSFFLVAVGVLMIVSLWKMFDKAGEPGWASIVPIYGLIVLLRIVDKPAWWFVLLCIPIVDIPFLIIVGVALAKRFGKGTGFGLGLALLPPIFYPILAFSDAN